MTALDEIDEAIESILVSLDGDDEWQHIQEDVLMRELIRSYCPPVVVDRMETLWDADFSRWCA